MPSNQRLFIIFDFGSETIRYVLGKLQKKYIDVRKNGLNLFISEKNRSKTQTSTLLHLS